MKKFIYFLAFIFIAFSCETENDKILNGQPEFEFKNLTNSKIALESKGKLTLNVSNEKILKTFENYSKKYGDGLKPQSYKIIQVDDKNYLRFFSNDNTVSTLALIKDNNNFYRTGSTVCETKACASGGGCVPNGNYCTKCRKPESPPQSPDGDCKRTTTGLEQIEG